MKKALQLVLALLMSVSLFSCTKENVNENIETQKAFEAFLDEQFEEYLTSDFLNYHYSIVDPTSYGLTKPQVTLGHLSTQSILDDIESTKEDLQELKSIQINELNREQQRIYKILEREFNEMIELEQYLNFYFLFGESKVNDNLVTNFTEYRLQNEEDLEDYIILLNDVERYLNEGIERTKEMAQAGFIQKESEKKAILEQCESFISGSEIQLHVKDALANMELDDATKKDYEKRVDQAVNESVIPAYKALIDLYYELPKADNQGSYFEQEGGRDYFAYLIKTKIGSEKSIDAWIKECEDVLEETIQDWIHVMITNPNIDEELNSIQMPSDNAKDMVKALEESIYKEYPVIDEVIYSVDYLDASVATDLVAAYYVIPPIDMPNQNVIKVNPNYSDTTDLFSTLAHEGFPGHLYQNNYRIQHEDHKIYHIIGNTGYSEGWAQYVGIDAYHLADVGSEAFQRYMKDYNVLNYVLVEYLDLQVNYHGWKANDIAEYMSDLGLVADGAADLYDTVILRAGQYAPYALGLMEMMSLRDQCVKVLGDQFDVLEFHQAILDANEVPFEFLEESVAEYIDKYK